MTGIYKITETATGKCYIGQSTHIQKRWKFHHKRFSPNAYTYEVLMECDADMLCFFERAFISGYDCLTPKGLNRTVGGNGMFGHTDEETRRKQSEAGKGKTHSEEHRRKMSEAAKGKTYSEEHRRKMSEASKGKPKSEEHRRNVSESLKAYYAQKKEDLLNYGL